MTSASVRLKRFSISKILLSTYLGALKPEQTTKISAETYLDAFGLTGLTSSKNLLKTQITELKSLDLNNFVTNVPFGLRTSVANLNALTVKSF